MSLWLFTRFIVLKKPLRITLFECTSLIINFIACEKAVASTVKIGHLLTYIFQFRFLLIWNIIDLSTFSSAVSESSAYTFRSYL